MSDDKDRAAPPPVILWAADCIRVLTVGETYYVRTVRNDYVGRLASIDGPYSLTLTDAAWVSESGRLGDFMRTGRAEGMEVEPVGVVGLQWLDWSPWPHALFPEAV